MRIHNYYVYMLTNWNNNVLYTGVSNDVDRRHAEHREGKGSVFVRKYNLTKMVYLEHTHDVNAAIAREKEIKGWRRSRKDALVESLNPNWDDLYDSMFNRKDPSLALGMTKEMQ